MNNVKRIIKSDIQNEFKVCLNYFQFDNKTFRCRWMFNNGELFSLLIVEILMDEINNFIHENSLTKYFSYWYHYIYDIMTCLIQTNNNNWT